LYSDSGSGSGSCRVRVASSAAVSSFSSDSEDSSSDDDDGGGNLGSSDISRRGIYAQSETADDKDDSIDVRKTATSNPTRRCFNFDINGQQKSMIQRVKDKDKGKKKKNKGLVRFLTEGEIPPEFAPTDNVMPLDSCTCTPRSRADSVSAIEWGSDVDGLGDMWKEHRGTSSVSLSNADSRRSSSSTLNDSAGGRLSLLETVGAAILTLFSSRVPSAASTPSTTSTSSSTATSTSTPATYTHGHM
jgi:hypothetical protein